MTRLRAAALACGLAFALGASAQTLYKWIDAQGRVQYSDKPPKGHKGEVTTIENEPLPPPVQRPAQPRKASAEPEGAKPDIAAQRRATRERLGANITRARERLEAAKLALEEGQAPMDDERQVIQQRVAKGGNAMPQPIRNPDAGQARQAGGGMHGMSTTRTNCREVVAAGGRKTVICPTMIPGGEAYRERIRKLEEDVAAAEAALAEAEIAYRRGVD